MYWTVWKFMGFKESQNDSQKMCLQSQEATNDLSSVRDYTTQSTGGRDRITQSTSSRGYTTTHSTDTSGRTHSVFCPGPPNSAPLSDQTRPPWAQLTQRGILSMAETICYLSQTFAGRISLFSPTITQDTWVIQTVTEGYYIPSYLSPTDTPPLPLSTSTQRTWQHWRKKYSLSSQGEVKDKLNDDHDIVPIYENKIFTFIEKR